MKNLPVLFVLLVLLAVSSVGCSGGSAQAIDPQAFNQTVDITVAGIPKEIWGSSVYGTELPPANPGGKYYTTSSIIIRDGVIMFFDEVRQTDILLPLWRVEHIFVQPAQ